jgi:hypothetical protein
MANKVITEFEKIGSWFKSWFKKVPSWNVIALSALGVIAPLVETIVDLADPAAGAVITPIFTAIQSKLGTVASLLSSGSTTNLATTIQSILTDLPTILPLLNIKDAATQEKVTAATTSITSELEAILAAIPA